MPRFETERLILRRTVLADTEPFFELASDAEVGRLSLAPVLRTLAQAKQAIRMLDAGARMGQPSPWTMQDRETGQWIGTIGVSHVFSHGKSVRVGFAIRRGFWNRGYTTEALRGLHDFLFERLPVNRIEALCFAENAASRKVMEKSGMLLEGTMREYIHAGGEIFDTTVYAIIRRDWESGRTTAERRT